MRCSFHEFFHWSDCVPSPSTNALQIGGLVLGLKFGTEVLQHTEQIPKLKTIAAAMTTVKNMFVFVMAESHYNFPREFSLSKTENHVEPNLSSLCPRLSYNHLNKLLIPSLNNKIKEHTVTINFSQPPDLNPKTFKTNQNEAGTLLSWNSSSHKPIW